MEQNKIDVAVCETLPLVVEGLKKVLAETSLFRVSDVPASLEEAARVVLVSGPRVLILDKAWGTPAVMDWLGRLRRGEQTSVVIWGAAMNEAEAVRFLKSGARGVLRKTAAPNVITACLEAVAGGGSWMEESLFQEGRHDRRNRTELTARELQVLELVEQGLRNKEIASDLGIRPGTVKIHLKHIFEKTGVRGRYGLALSGLRDRVEQRTAFVA